MTVSELRSSLQQLGVSSPLGGRPVLLERLKGLLKDLGVSTADEAMQMGGKPAAAAAGKKRARDADPADGSSRKKAAPGGGLFPPPSSTPTGSSVGLASENASLRREVAHLRAENDQLRQQLSQQAGVGGVNTGTVDLLLKQTERSLEQTQRLYDQLSAHKQSLEDLA